MDLQPPLDSLAEWIRATDGHARHRLPLLVRAQRILAGEEDAPPNERHDLAVRLERWRYQHLSGRGGSAGPLGRRLAEVLDLATNHLAGRAPRPPRWPRDAILDSSRDPEDVVRAAAALDPDVPLELLARQAAELTRENFSGRQTDSPLSAKQRRMLLYAPLYLSSHCINYCVYCGFRYPNQIERRHLSVEEALRQAEILRGRRFRHILLVAGDFPRLTATAYYGEIIAALSQRAIQTAVEIAPQTVASYAELAAAGACGVTLYQETYHEQLYALYHPRGSKAAYDWRLEALERAAEAGIGRLGLGILLGLADPREDLLAMIRHAYYLHSRFPDRTLAFSLPRIHEAPAGFEPPYPVDDETFVRLYCALRVGFPQAELVLSTREAAELRNRLAGICITQLSAGSCTIPGGYEDGGTVQRCGGQFPVHDHRSPAEVAEWLARAGLAVAWEIERR
jgi:2-iminoacetate synthase